MKIFEPYKGRTIARKRQIMSIPEVLDFKDLLYIGASPERFELVDLFYHAGYSIDVLEIHEPNVIALRKINKKHWIFNRVMLGDVRHVEKVVVHRYDITLFWHGPEHLHLNEVAPTLAKLEDWTKHLLICGSPWGEYPQGPIKGNEHEVHRCSLFPEDFKKLGFKTSTIRRHPGRGSNLIAWKRTNVANNDD